MVLGARSGTRNERRTGTVDELIRRADELIAKQRRLITILELELGRRIDDRREDRSKALSAR